MEKWRKHEEKEVRETLAAQAERELRQKWEQHEARKCYMYGPKPGTRYRADTMSQPVLRPARVGVSGSVQEYTMQELI